MTRFSKKVKVSGNSLRSLYLVSLPGLYQVSSTRSSSPTRSSYQVSTGLHISELSKAFVTTALVRPSKTSSGNRRLKNVMFRHRLQLRIGHLARHVAADHEATSPDMSQLTMRIGINRKLGSTHKFRSLSTESDSKKHVWSKQWDELSFGATPPWKHPITTMQKVQEQTNLAPSFDF